MSSWRQILRFGALPVWTLLVWVPRIRNIWSDDELSTAGQSVRTLWAVIFIVFAVGALVPARRWPTGHHRWLQAFVVFTVGFWAVRGTQIALADHEASFVAVHTVLALVSIGLALWSWPRAASAVTAGWYEYPAGVADEG